MDLSIIIVNWNSKNYLRKCIASILAETHGIEFEIVVIDSASYDGCGEMLRSTYPQVQFIQSDRNIGFAKANNAAFQASTGEYALFLNPDTELVGPAINILLQHLQTLPQAGALGGKLLNSDRTLQTSCIQSSPTVINQLLSSDYLRAKWPKSRLWGMAALYQNSSKPQEVEAISGACILTRRDTFERVKRFSEDYFMYAEDIDLSQKFRAAGYRNYYVSAACMVHHGGSSSRQAPSNFSVVMNREAIWLFLRKWRGRASGVTYRFVMFVSAIGRLFVIRFSSLFKSNSRKKLNARDQKWMAILRWSLNRDDSVKHYYRA